MGVNDLSTYMKKRFGHKVYKLALNGGMSCPNRDGTIGTKGCIFCSEGGSGEFAADPGKSVTEQIEQAKMLVRRKIQDGKYIAYFQAYTNTYAPVEYLRKIFTEAILHPDIEVLSIATRPDCINEENVALLCELNKIKPVWVELGLQTANENTARFICRGYENKVFENAVNLLISNEIDVIVHIIIGLPGEGRTEILDSIRYINRFRIQGVKLQLLHILKGTELEKHYYAHPFPILSMEEYTDILLEAIEWLRSDIVIHRMTGDGAKKLLLEPIWSANKHKVMNYIQNEIKKRNIEQGTKGKVTGGLRCQ